MPAGPQAQGSRSQRSQEKTRYATSCTECRRRKQKCSQGQPCTKCLRKFPQTTCEYTTTSTQRAYCQGSTRANDVKVVVEGPAYSHLDVSELQDAILQLEWEGRERVDKNDSSTFSVKYPRCQNSNNAMTNVYTAEGEDSKLNSKSNNGASGKEQPFKIIVKDGTALLLPQNMQTLLKTIL